MLVWNCSSILGNHGVAVKEGMELYGIDKKIAKTGKRIIMSTTTPAGAEDEVYHDEYEGKTESHHAL